MKKEGKGRPSSKNNKNVAVKNLASGSTKAAPSLMGQGFPSQRFIVPKDQMSQNKKHSNKNIKKNNLYDLQRTLDINIEIIKNFFKNTTSAMTLLNQDKYILEKLDSFMKKYNKKKRVNY